MVIELGAHIDDEDAASEDAVESCVMAATHIGVRRCLTWHYCGPTRVRSWLRRVSWRSLLCAALLLRQLPVLLWWHVRCAMLSMLCGRVMVALCGLCKVLLC